MGQSWTNRVHRVMLLCAVNLSLYLNCFAGVDQGEKKVTLNVVEESCVKVFKQIEKQTKMSFFYSTSDIRLPGKVSINVVDAALDEVMGRILEGTNLEWIYTDNVITIRKKKEHGSLSASNGDSTITSITITGNVTAADGTPIPGATVRLKKTNEGITTDADGKFSLPNVPRNATLIISSIGYEAREFVVKGKTILAQLTVDVNKLDETVVVAYGTTTQRFNTGNATTIKAKDIEKQPINNPLLALQGRVPGLFIEQATGLSGSGVKVRIQGQNSLLNGNDPLYVIDGVPYTSQLLPNLGSMLGDSRSAYGFAPISGNPLSFINPSDIESINVLKDADATAIYGSRAANGAILITTKKGKPGQTTINVNMQSGWADVQHSMDLMNSQQYLFMRHEALKNDGISTPSSTDYDLNGLWDTTHSTDWQKELIGKTARFTDIQISVSGGNTNTQFLVGAGYHKETTVFPGDFNDKKGSVHFNVNNISTNQKFKIQLSGSYLVDNNQLFDGDLTSYALSLAPIAPELYNKDGNLNWVPNPAGSSTFYNPLRNTFNKYKNKTTNLISNVQFSYQIVPGLEFKTSAGYTNLQSNEVQIYPLISMPPENRPYELRISTFGNNNINSWIVEPQMNFNRILWRGKMDFLMGTTIQQNNAKGQQLIGYGYNSDQVMEDIGSAPNFLLQSSVASTYKYNALFSRLTYNLLDKYIVNFSARRDGSSRFGSKNQFHNFGAIAGAWIFSKEAIFTKNLSFISFGKVRASYGTTGNDQITDYRFLNLYEPVRSNIPYQGGTGLQPNGLTNPYLQWEETRKFQLGLDLGFLKDKILINANYFHNRSSNQLLEYALPYMTGVGGIVRNFPATIQNTGWEIAINSTNLRSTNFNWSSSLNITIPKNKLVAFPDIENSSYAESYVVGQSILFTKVFQFAGVNDSSGLYQFRERKGNLTLDPSDPDDKTVFINTAPKFYGGFQNSLSFKGIELDFLFQFVKQNGIDYSLGGVAPGRFNAGAGNQPLFINDHWQEQHNASRVQKYSSNSSDANNAHNRAKFSSDAVWSDASYIRLKNLSLSWQIPAIVRKRMSLKSCRVYLQCQNLFTITNYKGLDPETKSMTSLPPLRVITAGIQASL